MKRFAVLACLVILGCRQPFVLTEQPTETQVIEVPTPVPGETEIIEIPVLVVDTALVRQLLRGFGELSELECTVPHEHAHRGDVCTIIARTLRGLETLP